MNFEKTFEKLVYQMNLKLVFRSKKLYLSSLQSSLFGIIVIQKILLKISFTIPGNTLLDAIDFQVKRLITITKVRIPQ